VDCLEESAGLVYANDLINMMPIYKHGTAFLESNVGDWTVTEVFRPIPNFQLNRVDLLVFQHACRA
jgi:hypothetical protein